MIKKIFHLTFLAIFSILTFSVILIVILLYRYFGELQKNQLKMEVTLIAKGVTFEGKNFFEDLETKNIRITWINSEGDILFDNQSRLTKMDNHANREEIYEALQTGYGESLRYSNTMTTESLYVAKLLDNGTVIRLSVTQKSLIILILGMFQPLILIMLLALFLSMLVAKYIAKRIVMPLNQLDIENPLSDEIEVYEEISPFLRKITTYKKEIDFQKKEIKQHKEEFDMIISKIKEGMILLDNNYKIISINESAQNLLRADLNCMNQNILTVFRDFSFYKLFEFGMKGKNQEGIIVIENSTYRVMIRPIFSKNFVTGLMILFFDITEKIQAEQMRKEFTANVSHELKTPLHIISGYSEIIAKGLVSDKDIVNFTKQIYNEVQRTIKLVEDIIHLSLLDENEQILKESIDIYQISKEVIKNLSSKSIEYKINLTLKGTSSWIFGNYMLLYSTIYNLCDNAIIYSYPNSEVQIIITTLEDKIYFEIHDKGIGIPKEEQDRIFERFYRIDKSRSKKLGGTGLGLSIVKHALKCHNTNIKVDSQIGIGTTMTIIFEKHKDFV